MDVFSYQLTGTILVVVIATCLTSVTAFADDSCSSKVIGQKENACFAHYNLTDAFRFGLPQPAHLTLFTHSMYDLCRNIVNLTSCLEDAMTSCGDPYFDFSSYSNTINKICNHRNLFYAAEAHCEMIDTLQTCIGQYNTDIQDLKYHIYLNMSEIPLSDMCTVLQNTRNCFHINETADCKPELSEFLTSLYRGRFLPAVCSKNTVTNTNSCRRVHFSVSQILFLFTVLTFLNEMLCLYCFDSTDDLLHYIL